MMSDFAFYSISLSEDAPFAIEYGGDFQAVRRSSLAFCILGVLLWVPDM